MLVPRVCAPRVTRCRLGKYWSCDWFRGNFSLTQGLWNQQAANPGVHRLSMTHSGVRQQNLMMHAQCPLPVYNTPSENILQNFAYSYLLEISKQQFQNIRKLFLNFKYVKCMDLKPSPYQLIHSGCMLHVMSWCNICSKTLLGERDKLPIKLSCPAGTSTFPATLINKGITLWGTLLAKRGKLGSCSAWPIAVFCRIHLQLATGRVVMLHTECRKIHIIILSLNVYRYEDSVGSKKEERVNIHLQSSCLRFSIMGARVPGSEMTHPWAKTIAATQLIW